MAKETKTALRKRRNEFISDYIAKNPKATVKEIKAAATAAGFDLATIMLIIEMITKILELFKK